MLSQVHFKTIKSLLNVAVDLAPFTVLVGPNGAGKSTLREHTRLLCEMASAPTQIPLLVDKDQASTLRTTHQTDVMAWEGHHTAGDFFSVTADDSKNSISYRAYQSRSGHSFSIQNLSSAVPLGWHARTLRIAPARVASPTPIVEDPYNIAQDGAGLPALLAHLAINERAQFEQIQADLRQVVPHFEAIFLRQARLPERDAIGYTIDLQLRGAGRIPASHASEGTLIALGLLTVVHSAASSLILLIDDIDHGLHLSAQTQVIQAIRRVQEVRPDLQVICTTHAPYLLDQFKAEEVRVLGLTPAGYTVCKPLTAHPEYEKWHTMLQTGEFWASVGEDWTTEAQNAG